MLSSAESEQGMRIRDALASDIPAINDLFCREYGAGYPYLVRALNPAHVNLVSEVNGVIVGFARAAPYGRYTHVWELCSLMVRSDMRGRGIARAFTVERMERLKQMGVKTLVSETVTCYEDCASQRNLLNFGFEIYGLIPFMHPWIRPEVLGRQPLTLMMMVATLNGGTGFGSRQLHLNQSDRNHALEVVSRAALNAPWEQVLEGAMPDPGMLPGKLVNEIEGASFIDVPLNWADSLGLVQALRRQGYLFAALLPGFGRTPAGQLYDLARFYRPAQVDALRFDLIHVVPEMEQFKRLCENAFARTYDEKT